ncbi:hypothetical protein HNQ95_001951 [Aminobacter ciceronei]|jgi:hypothetical protein|uniref:Uncharacterized protein n=2 Tax=Aminobacter TaxID=31988 RepID=A0AAC9ARJ9_AMIAI|nr:hypothetical protein AA2016_3195 [Aminobacter aminovorans]MBA8906178.1 hypothetical protein [Aminobacter ciceronei]MBA9019957.1 hypothetical protein [Aminobacter ciceronei]MBB3706641.1 hypothetical protein [Aminobacter aminovorans]
MVAKELCPKQVGDAPIPIELNWLLHQTNKLHEPIQ